MSAKSWQEQLDGIPPELLTAEEKVQAEAIILRLPCSSDDRLALFRGDKVATSRRIKALLQGTWGVGAVPEGIAARASACCKHAAHIMGMDSFGLPVKTAAVVVDKKHVATYAHSEHANMKVGDEVMVYVNDSRASQRCPTACTVSLVEPGQVPATSSRPAHQGTDVVIMRVKDDEIELEAPVLDTGVQPGEPYLLIGQSTQAQGDAVSTSHGQIAATVLTSGTQHLRGDTPAGLGGSGGGVFAVMTGKLIGMCVGTDAANKSVLVPSAVLQHMLQSCP